MRPVPSLPGGRGTLALLTISRIFHMEDPSLPVSDSFRKSRHTPRGILAPRVGAQLCLCSRWCACPSAGWWARRFGGLLSDSCYALLPENHPTARVGKDPAACTLDMSTFPANTHAHRRNQSALSPWLWCSDGEGAMQELWRQASHGILGLSLHALTPHQPCSCGG